jgi:hypothetical protein
MREKIVLTSSISALTQLSLMIYLTVGSTVASTDDFTFGSTVASVDDLTAGSTVASTDYLTVGSTVVFRV